MKSMPTELFRMRTRNLPAAIIFPAILSVALFVMTIFLLVLPALESALMEQRRAMSRELTEVAWSTLARYQEKQTRGELSREQAQAMALDQLAHLRYGTDSKDYFWINDMHPYLIMHPYRPDLVGRDVSDFADPDGKKLFAEFVQVVEKHGAGYVDYKWQWMDEPGRIVQKISYVKGFRPWGWIVGTGIYFDDIRAEIDTITRKLTWICLGILLLVFLLCFLIIRQGIRVERKRQEAEDRNRMQQEQLFQAAKMASLGTLVSGVAHEINNPNTSILMNASILNKTWKHVLPVLNQYAESHSDFAVGGMDYSGLKDRIPRLLDDIEENAGRIRDIVGELKTFAQQSPPDLNDDVDINLAVRKAQGLTANLIKKSTDHFSINSGADIPLFRGNRRKVEQVLINLLINACQSLTERSQPIEIQTCFEPASRTVVVEVRDGGRGIPADLLGRIKDPFFTTRQNDGNTGLGLAISDNIMKDHGGEMLFTSSPGSGTIASLRFPVRQPHPHRSDHEHKK